MNFALSCEFARSQQDVGASHEANQVSYPPPARELVGADAPNSHREEEKDADESNRGAKRGDEEDESDNEPCDEVESESVWKLAGGLSGVGIEDARAGPID